MVGVTLVNCDPEGIKFLFDILQDVSDVLEDMRLSSVKRTAMNGVKTVVSEALETYRMSGDGTGASESQNLSERESGTGHSEHINENFHVEGWKFERLCKWILDQIRAHGLEDNVKCKQIMLKVEEKCAGPKTANETFNHAAHADTSQCGAIEGAHDSSPISLLPFELLQHIFCLAASSHHWIRGPLLLSLVNSHFRAIVLGTASLWTTVDNHLPLPILQLYVARSKNEPLDVLTRTDNSPRELICSSEDWFNFLSDECARIKFMAVVGSDPDRVSDWGGGLGQSGGITFTGLKGLALRVISGKHERVLCPNWAHFPDLRELWLQGCWCSGWANSFDPFPRSLQRLRFTKISSISLLNLLNALDGVPGLVGLVMEDLGLDGDQLSDSPIRSPVPLDLLEELEFANVSITDIKILSLYLTTPNVSSLSITSSEPSDGITEFLATFTVHRPQLSSLRILGFSMELKEIKRVLHSLTSLDRLHIRASDLVGYELAVLEEGGLSPLLMMEVS